MVELDARRASVQRLLEVPSPPRRSVIRPRTGELRGPSFSPGQLALRGSLGAMQCMLRGSF